MIISPSTTSFTRSPVIHPLKQLLITPFSHYHFISAMVHHMTCFQFISFIILLHLSGYLPLTLSISPFQIFLTLPFCYLCSQLVFSHHPIISLHLPLLFLNLFRSQLPYLTKRDSLNVILLTFPLNFHILHLDH